MIDEIIENAKKYGIKIKMCLIFGLPGEPRNIVDKTIKFITQKLKSYYPDKKNLKFVMISGIFSEKHSEAIQVINI